MQFDQPMRIYPATSGTAIYHGQKIMREGIDPRRFQKISGRAISERQINELRSIGFVETLPNGFIRVTDKGWPVLDAVVADLAA